MKARGQGYPPRAENRMEKGGSGGANGFVALELNTHLLNEITTTCMSTISTFSFLILLVLK